MKQNQTTPHHKQDCYTENLSAKIHSFGKRYEALFKNRPSVIRYTLLLWLLKIFVALLPFICLLLFASTYFDYWIDLHAWILNQEKTEIEDSAKTMLVIARYGISGIFILSLVCYWLCKLVLRRNSYIIDQEELWEETLQYLKEKTL